MGPRAFKLLKKRRNSVKKMDCMRNVHAEERKEDVYRTFRRACTSIKEIPVKKQKEKCK